MTYQEKLCRFMQEKHDIINKHFSLDYFTTQDKQSLLSLTDTEAGEVWKAIKRNVFLDAVKGFEVGVCPFCLLLRNCCDGCLYAKVRNRKRCYDVPDWEYIAGLADIYLTNKVLGNIVTKIEREIK